MLLFWAAAGILTAAAAGLMLMRAAGASAEAAAVDPAPALYRRQLGEIDDLAERGLMGEAERAAAHAEAGRRLLAATDAPAQLWNADPRARRLVLLVLAAAPALALGLYLKVGSPGTVDQPYGRRLAAWQRSDLASLNPPEIAAVLRQATAERPNEAEGFRLLGLAESASQNPIAAVRALRRAAQIAPERPDIWLMLGQAQVAAAGGKAGPAQGSFERVLQLVPGDPTARYFLAGAKADAGKTAEAVAELTALAAEFPAGDERRAQVQAAIARLQGQPAAVTTASGQLAMIQGMVSGLAARLQAKPDDPDGWVRLVRAYAVLGDTTKRDVAYATARAKYAAKPQVLEQLDEAAKAQAQGSDR